MTDPLTRVGVGGVEEGVDRVSEGKGYCVCVCECVFLMDGTHIV